MGGARNVPRKKVNDTREVKQLPHGKGEYKAEPVGNAVGGEKRFRNVLEHPLSLAWDRGRIDAFQHAAGTLYRRHYETRHRSGKSSLQLVSGGASQGLTDAQCDASQWLKRVEARLGRNDKELIRLTCGEGYAFPEAMALAGLTGTKRITERMAEALDALAWAIKHG